MNHIHLPISDVSSLIYSHTKAKGGYELSIVLFYTLTIFVSSSFYKSAKHKVVRKCDDALVSVGSILLKGCSE